MDFAPLPPQVKKKSTVREYAEALATALLVALFLRAFVVEAFKVPSGSMLPSIMIGDHLFVNKFIYGLRLPFTRQWLYHFESPERGETVVFIYPVDERKDFIKRVVGLPGDYVRLNGTELTVNGEPVRQELLDPQVSPDKKELLLTVAGEEEGGVVDTIDAFPHWEEFNFYREFLGDEPHLVLYSRGVTLPPQQWIVPPGHLFVMGDNRHHSSDSRDWGFVPLKNLKGKAMFVWLSLDYEHIGIRWKRFGHWIE